MKQQLQQQRNNNNETTTVSQTNNIKIINKIKIKLRDPSRRYHTRIWRCIIFINAVVVDVIFLKNKQRNREIKSTYLSIYNKTPACGIMEIQSVRKKRQRK